ncbi:MAG: type-F conjugative transfer system pilin assembly protein TrbC [Alphaproteobacteria bacterium]|nr:type-F conjugative transfer system pilin assembly protein TrbC [Alphaproteobacteria bacterium]MBP9777283.1 type-F conjugative transfer system pilin assembly protein TrbC [Alphaproteobacteria bacterium]
MLRVVKLSFFIFWMSLITLARAEKTACSLDHDLSWVRELNLQAEKLSTSSQQNAQTIVEIATKAASQGKQCAVVQNLVHQGEKSVRQTLTHAHPNLAKDEDNIRYPKLLVFVSFSMPRESLKALGTHVNQLGGRLVLRGLLNGNFRETAQKLKDLQEEVVIDPPLFEAYQVEHVPTFVLRQKNTERAEEEVIHDRLVGNVSLEYALEQFTSSGETHQEAAEMLHVLREKS